MKKNREILKEVTIKSRYITEEGIFKVKFDEVMLPNGKTSKRNVVEHRGGCCVLVVDKNDNSCYMVRQYRYAVDEVLLELPAGKLEANEDHYYTALRECQEECGILPNKLVYLGYNIPTCGYSTERIHMYYCDDFSFNKLDCDEDEDLDVVKIPLNEVYDMIRTGEITDGKTICAVLKYKLIDESQN